MPVHVEVRLVRLALGFEQRRRLLQERHAEVVRAGRHRDADLQVRVDRARMILAARPGGFTVNELHALAVEQHFQLRAARASPSTCSLRSRASRTWMSYSPSCGNV